MQKLCSRLPKLFADLGRMRDNVCVCVCWQRRQRMLYFTVLFDGPRISLSLQELDWFVIFRQTFN